MSKREARRENTDTGDFPSKPQAARRPLLVRQSGKCDRSIYSVQTVRILRVNYQALA